MSSNCSTPSATFFRHRSISPERQKQSKKGELSKKESYIKNTTDRDEQTNIYI